MIAVTGLTGRTGRYLLEEFNRQKAVTEQLTDKHGGIRALVRKTSDCSKITDSELPIELLYGDLNNENDLLKLTENADTILHISGIRKSIPILKAAAANGVKRAILVHTTGIYSKYKSASEEYLEIEKVIYRMAEDNGIKLTILRPTMIYGSPEDGNMIKFIQMVDKLKAVPVVNRAEYLLQPVNAKDLGIAYFNVLVKEQETSGKDYVLSGEKPILLIDILKEIEKNLNKKRIYVNVPFGLAYAAACALRVISLKKIDLREKVQRLCEDRSYSHDEAKKDFGYTPMPFSEGIANEVKQYLEGR